MSFNFGCPSGQTLRYILSLKKMPSQSWTGGTLAFSTPKQLLHFCSAAKAFAFLQLSKAPIKRIIQDLTCLPASFYYGGKSCACLHPALNRLL
ncbi:hypothetical protein [Mucilaginibacter aquaedulcis]|uniref:hypothetical protein n=1 Tax=Mucilaginibacter aquaedulcis TaxID=1187081 RepID=UPI0025B37D3A|nr:hypothetical protein [Mucilaginibacter aquaedulcis]MDN3551580.1 hypothetical protein [Mucilaginibacter aquaedulcis]